MPLIIVVTEHALSDADAKSLVELGDDSGAPRFHVAVPEHATSASMNAVMDDWEMNVTAGRGSGAANHPDRQTNPEAVAAREAQAELEASLGVLRAAGAEADGEVTPKHPLDTIGDMVAHLHPDEIVVMVRHHKLSAMTSSDLAGRIKRAFGVETLRVKEH